MKRSFTLFELMVVLLLVGLVSGVGMLVLPKAFHQFDKSVHRLTAKLELVQEIAVDYDMTLLVRLEQERKGLRCRILPLKKVPERLQRILDQDAFLPDITSCSHQELLFERGGKTPCTTLVLKGKKSVELALKGFPSRIERGHHETKEYEIPYPEEILSPA